MNEQEKIIQLLKNSTVSAYKIAKATGISEAAIGNYLAEKSKPNKIYTKCLMYYFDSQMKSQTQPASHQNQSIVGDNNTVAGKSIFDSGINIENLLNQLEFKTNLINSLLKTQEMLLNQIDKLISK